MILIASSDCRKIIQEVIIPGVLNYWMGKARYQFTCCFAAVVAAVVLSADARAAAKPNFVFIIVDQLYGRDIGAAGNSHVRTPAIDSLAARGVRFDKSYCTFPVCSPSRASMVTSRMPHEMNIFGNNRATIPPGVQQMGELFQKAGYRTAWAGKWHVPAPYPAFDGGKGGPRGFDLLQLEGPRHRSNPNVGPAAGSDPLTAKAAVKFLSEPQNAPFLLTLSLLNPHDICEYPNAPEKYPKPAPGEALPPLPPNFYAIHNEPSSLQAGRDRKHRRGDKTTATLEKEWQTYRWVYFRLIEAVDSHIASVLEALDKSGHRDNTIIIFTSDHGEMAGAHQLQTKLQMYEEAANVPLIICVPGKTKGYVDKAHIVSGLDILPTMCDFADIELLDSFEGRSLRALAESAKPQSGSSWRDHLVVEMGEKEYVRMVRSNQYKYVVYASSRNPEMLFDMRSDPHETRNLARDPALKDVVASHRAMLKEWIAKTNDPFVLPAGI